MNNGGDAAEPVSYTHLITYRCWDTAWQLSWRYDDVLIPD